MKLYRIPYVQGDRRHHLWAPNLEAARNIAKAAVDTYEEVLPIEKVDVPTYKDQLVMAERREVQVMYVLIIAMAMFRGGADVEKVENLTREECQAAQVLWEQKTKKMFNMESTAICVYRRWGHG